MITCSIPAATASSTAYWMIGLSTSGSISLGWALVAGRNRVPQPAAGKTAFRTRIEPRALVIGASPAGRSPVGRHQPDERSGVYRRPVVTARGAAPAAGDDDGQRMVARPSWG